MVFQRCLSSREKFMYLATVRTLFILGVVARSRLPTMFKYFLPPNVHAYSPYSMKIIAYFMPRVLACCLPLLLGNSVCVSSIRKAEAKVSHIQYIHTHVRKLHRYIHSFTHTSKRQGVRDGMFIFFSLCWIIHRKTV